jgi:hypothetical protein
MALTQSTGADKHWYARYAFKATKSLPYRRTYVIATICLEPRDKLPGSDAACRHCGAFVSTSWVPDAPAAPLVTKGPQERILHSACAISTRKPNNEPKFHIFRELIYILSEFGKPKASPFEFPPSNSICCAHQGLSIDVYSSWVCQNIHMRVYIYNSPQKHRNVGPCPPPIVLGGFAIPMNTSALYPPDQPKS